MNLRRLASVAVLSGAFLTRLAAALDPSAWEWQQTFELPAAGPVRVTIPPEIRAAARRDAADLRLLGPDGREVAFAQLNGIEDAPPPPSPIVVRAATRLEGNTTVIEFDLPAPTDFDALQFNVDARQFLKGVRISCDGSGAPGTSGILYRQRGGGEELSIPVHARQTKHVRAIVDDSRTEPVPITVQWLRPLPAGWSSHQPTTEFRTQTDSSAGNTRLRVDLGARHRLVTFIDVSRSDAVYLRRLSLIERRLVRDEIEENAVAEGWILGSVFDAASPALGDRKTGGLRTQYLAPSNQLELSIDDGDSPPLPWTVVIGFAPEFLAFAAPTPGRYTLLAGNDAAQSPRYDVAAFRAQWLRTPLTEIRPGTLSRNTDYRAPEVPTDVPELAGAFQPEGWKHRRSVVVREAGAQALELDLDVLAHAKPTLGDLRLVRDQRQVPYLIERSGRERATPLQFAAAPDAKRPSVGRWKLALPAADAPYRAVRLSTDEKLFERRIVLYELAPDGSGDRARRAFGAWTWTRRGADAPGGITLPLDGVPRTRELFLEIEHGDNAPFAPARVEITHPIVRLRFRASQPGELALHFGNPEARAPSYDLQLVAPKLVAAPEIRSDFILDVEGRPVDGNAIGGRVPLPKLIFWGSLVLMVVVLLFFVARLLPKPPPGSP